MPGLYCMGNPLLDISAEVTDDFLKKYEISLNNAILAEDKHAGIYADMIEHFKVDYIAGGATQNSARVCKWIVGDGASVAYVGSVGSDEYAKTLETSARSNGVDVVYKHCEGTPTGTCAVCVHGKERSLVANLAAAEKYDIAHFQSSDVQDRFNKATHIYISGFFLTHSADTIMEVCKAASASGKIMTMNVAAPFLLEVPFFAEKFKEFWPYLDIVFGNESEALCVAKAFGWDTTDVKEIALKAAALPRVNESKVRHVVFTQGCDPTIIASSSGEVESHAVNRLPSSAIVDTNGAGDAFVGGFLAAMMMGGNMAKCAECGAFCGGMIVQRSGCSLPTKQGQFTQSFW